MRFGAEMDLRPAQVAQFQVAGGEVRMEMGQHDVAYSHPKFFGGGDVFIHVPLGIDNDGGFGRLIGEQV
jgi:hypothetical protein